MASSESDSRPLTAVARSPRQRTVLRGAGRGVLALVGALALVTSGPAWGDSETSADSVTQPDFATWTDADFGARIRQRQAVAVVGPSDKLLRRQALAADLQGVRDADRPVRAPWYPTLGTMSQTTQPSSTPSEEESESAGETEKGFVTELTNKLTNPVGDLWVITNQFVITQFAGRPLQHRQWQTNWNIQPVLPLHLTDKWNLINRPVVPLYFGSPYPERHGFGVDTEYLSGIGDIQLPMMLTPRQTVKCGDGALVLAAGPTFIFPTAGPGGLGSGVFQAGPAAVVAWFNEKWFIGAFAQQWWGFGGNEHKPTQNHLSVQYFIQYQFLPGWQVGLGTPIATVDWTESCSRGFTFPIGASLSKVLKIGKLPIKFAIEYDYAVVHPTDDVIGPRSIFKFTIAPVLPVLIPENLLPS